MRGQLSLPADMGGITPPSTGDAGLAGQGSSGLAMIDQSGRLVGTDESDEPAAAALRLLVKAYA